MIPNTTYSSPSDKDIDPDYRQDRVYLAKAKVNNIRYCDCPGNETGKIMDPSRHFRNCRFRKRKTVDISIPSNGDGFGGYSLGVAMI